MECNLIWDRIMWSRNTVCLLTPDSGESQSRNVMKAALTFFLLQSYDGSNRIKHITNQRQISQVARGQRENGRRLSSTISLPTVISFMR